MTPEELFKLETILQEAMGLQRRLISGALAQLANRLEQRARLQAQLFAELHFGKGQVPEDVTDQIAKIWLD